LRNEKRRKRGEKTTRRENQFSDSAIPLQISSLFYHFYGIENYYVFISGVDEELVLNLLVIFSLVIDMQ